MSVSLYHHKFGKHIPLIFHHVIFQANSLEIRRLVQMPRLANRMLRGSMLMNPLSWKVWLEDWYCENGLTDFDCNTSTYNIYIYIYIFHRFTHRFEHIHTCYVMLHWSCCPWLGYSLTLGQKVLMCTYEIFKWVQFDERETAKCINMLEQNQSYQTDVIV